MRRAVSAMVAMMLAGCGSDVRIGPDEPVGDVGYDVGVEPGTRLRPMMAVADGVAAFTGWYDSELGLRCRFRRMVDGVRRCLPVTPVVVFIDAACTQAAFIETPCRSGYEFASLGYQPGAPDCDISQQDASSTPYRRVSASVGATSFYTAYLTDDGLQCAEGSTPLVEDEVLIAAEEVPVDTFVAATKVVVAGPGDLGRAEWHAEDGAREVVRAVDLAHDAECLRYPFGAKDRCGPTEYAMPHFDRFSDDDCTGSTAFNPCDHELALTRAECTLRVFDVGDELEGTYSTEDQACTFQPSSDVHRLGEELSLESLPFLGEATFGEGRLKSRYGTDASGWRAAAAEEPLFDSELGTACSPALADDGGYYCTPAETLGAGDRFADPQCTQRVHVQQKAQCSKWPWLGWYDPAIPFCEQEVTTFEVREASTADMFYARTMDGGCSPAPLDDDEIAYELGPPRSVDSFAPVAIETW